MKLEIELNEKETRYLKRYVKLRDLEKVVSGTANPIVVVEERKHMLVDGERGADDRVYALEGVAELFRTEEELIDYISDDIKSVIGGEAPSNPSLSYTIEDIYVSYYYEPVAYFLTRKEANDYLANQKHNLSGHARVYSRCLNLNAGGELDTIMGLIRRIGEATVGGE
jgi:hypothetical protein